jgi:hypothetical protein
VFFSVSHKPAGHYFSSSMSLSRLKCNCLSKTSSLFIILFCYFDYVTYDTRSLISQTKSVNSATLLLPYSWYCRGKTLTSLLDNF